MFRKDRAASPRRWCHRRGWVRLEDFSPIGAPDSGLLGGLGGGGLYLSEVVAAGPTVAYGGGGIGVGIGIGGADLLSYAEVNSP